MPTSSGFRLWLCGLLMVFALAVSTNAQAENSLTQAKLAIRTNDFDQAIRLLTAQSEKGNREAQYQLANLYRAGRGGSNKQHLAFDLYQSASNAGHELASFSLAKMHSSGRGTQKSTEAAAIIYESLVSKGSVRAREQLALLRAPTKVASPQRSTISSSSTEEFLGAIRGKNGAAVRKLLALGASPKVIDTTGKTGLELAAESGDIGVLKLLLEHQSKPKADGLLVRATLSSGNPDLLALLIKHGAKVNEFSGFSSPALVVAVRKNNIEASRLLLKHGAKINLRGNNGESAHGAAEKHGSNQMRRLLAEHGAKFATTTDLTPQENISSAEILQHVKSNSEKGNKNHLIDAVKQGNIDIVEILIASGENLDAIDEHGDSALIEAVRGGKNKIVARLLNANATVDIANRSGKRAIHFAAQNGDLEIAKMLLERESLTTNAKPIRANAVTVALLAKQRETAKYLIENSNAAELSQTGKITPLSAAIQFKDQQLLALLLSNGASTSVGDLSGRFPLETAAKIGWAEGVKTLLSFRANPNDIGEQPPICLAAIGGHRQVVEILLPLSGPKSLVSQNGDTLLILAARGGHLELVEYLVALGDIVPLDKRNQQGNTALLIATSKNHLNVVEALLQRGANFRARNNKGENAVEIAKFKDFPEITQALELHRAQSGWLSKHL